MSGNGLEIKHVSTHGVASLRDSVLISTYWTDARDLKKEICVWQTDETRSSMDQDLLNNIIISLMARFTLP